MSERFLAPLLSSVVAAWILSCAGVPCEVLSGQRTGDDAPPTTTPASLEFDPVTSKALLFDGKALGLWKATEFPNPGPVTVRDGCVVLGSGHNLTGITWTGPVLRMNYEISLKAKRVAGADFFCGLTFPVGEEYCSLICGGWGGVLVGISCIDFRDADDNETGVGYDFEPDRWYTIRVRVTPDLIEAWIDSDQVVELETADRTLTVRDEVDESRPLGIATWRTTGAVRDIAIEKLDPTPRFIPTASYHSATVEGWQVLVSPELVGEHSGLAAQARQLLADQLRRIARVLPERPLNRMRQVKIWLEYRDRHYAQTCYHPDGAWLQKHGYNPDKALGVEIANAENFLTWSIDRPGSILHELSHAYHHQVMGHDHAGIREAFQHAKASGHYDRVLHASGEYRRHPAKNSATEYFARGMEAFYGRASYYPFVRGELKRIDPTLFRIIESLAE